MPEKLTTAEHARKMAQAQKVFEAAQILQVLHYPADLIKAVEDAADEISPNKGE